ncbi:hypothetical protein CHS0354_026409 [Potamilus streckersoni]|uniref:Mitochondria-eating protein C-terminal domain-containing protein n=1 Tax=Potamilus streckersoni TaxID=2493646 RepID=A0AAE0W7A5_9BIVA|nr:hypothetical protein CHS0354_026409 [Potamilus streckersoni]
MKNMNKIQALFDYVETSQYDKIKPRFVQEVENEYQANVTSLPSVVRKTAHFDNLFSLIDYCRNGMWTVTHKVYHAAIQEYDTMLHLLETSQGYNTFSTMSPRDVGKDSYETDILSAWTPRRIRQSREYDSKLSSPRSHRRSWFRNDPDTDIVLSARFYEGLSSYWGNNDLITPSRIAEKFQELFEREWLFALDELSVVLGEREAIYYLFKILRFAYDYCTRTAEKQLVDLTKVVTDVIVSPDNSYQSVENIGEYQKDSASIVVRDRARPHLIQLRRETAHASLPNVVKWFMTKQLPEVLPPGFKAEKSLISRYAQKCIELIWLMCAQDPPMHLEPAERGLSFDDEYFRVYSKTGSVVDFCVWPLLREFKNGPVLIKGVIQPI